MPQCSAETQAEMDRLFPITDDPDWGQNFLAQEYLEEVGITDVGGLFLNVSRKVWNSDERVRVALVYLRDEWDYDFELEEQAS